MCGITAAAVLLGGFAFPVSAWADDDDDFLEDLMDLSDEEVDALVRIADADGDQDVDEADVAVLSSVLTTAALVEADRQHAAEIEAARQAEIAALEAQMRAEKEAQEAKRRLEEELRLKQARVKGIWVSTTEVTLTCGQTYQVVAGVTPDYARNRGVHFSSSDTRVATVDGSGVIRAMGVGSCTITATSDDGGYSARTCVHVNPTSVVAAQTISQDAAWLAAAAQMVTAAAPKATVNLIAPKPLCFDAGLINALALRPDVSLNIAYPYNGHVYSMIVPAGYNLMAKMDKNARVSFLTLAAVKDGKIKVTLVQ